VYYHDVSSLQQARPVVAGRHGALPDEGLLRPSVGHLKEEELLDIVAVNRYGVPVVQPPKELFEESFGRKGD
jgi:hypothetical protein